jgi:hypothetical protein
MQEIMSNRNFDEVLAGTENTGCEAFEFFDDNFVEKRQIAQLQTVFSANV